MGVSLITLTHFFPNDIIEYPVEGISPDEKKTIGMKTEYKPENEKNLTDFGARFVERMLQLGIVVDLTHTNPKARKDVFALNKARGYNRPIVFSHSGAKAIFDRNNSYLNYGFYNADDEEIGLIKECKGVIGVIPEIFWLKGF